MNYTITNKNKMFIRPEWEHVITVKAFDILKKHVQSQKMSAKDQQTWDQIIPLLESCPTEKVSVMAKNINDVNNLKQKDYNNWMKGFGFHTVASKVTTLMGAPTSNSYTIKTHNDDLASWGLEQAHQLTSHIPFIEQWIKKYGLNITINRSSVKKASNVKARFDSGEYVLENFDLVANQTETASYAVFVSSHTHVGYLNSTGGVSKNLAAAKMFETTGAAQKASEKNWLCSSGKTAVVELKTQLVQLCHDTKNAHIDELQDALSHVQKKDIEQALQQANIDQIMRRAQEMGLSVEQPQSRKKHKM